MTPDASEGAPGEATAVILARMEVKLDHALANVTDHETRIRVLEDHKVPEIPDHEARIRALERKVWVASAVVGTAGGGLGALLTALAKQTTGG